MRDNRIKTNTNHPVDTDRTTMRNVEELISATEALIQIYEQETEALKASDTKTFLSLQDNKIEISQQYQDIHVNITAQKEALAALPVTLKDKLKDMDLKFKTTAQKNLKALNTMEKSMSRLNTRILNAAKGAIQEKRARYGADGTLNNEQNKRISISINESA